MAESLTNLWLDCQNNLVFCLHRLTVKVKASGIVVKEISEHMNAV